MNRLRVQLRRYALSFLALLGLIGCGAAAGFYILLQERLPNPFASLYTVNAAFPTASGVVPGLGEPVDIAGVHVGEISGTSLKDGRAVVSMEIDPGDVRHLYRDASAELIPETPLDNMEVDIQPGSRGAGLLPHGGTIPISETTSPTQLDELLDGLDTDSRTWLVSLITELGDGTQGRGTDIRKLLANLAPTAAQARQIGDLLASRRFVISAIVHNLGVLSSAASTKDSQIQTIIRSGDETLGALASQDVALHAAIERLPGTLATTRTTLANLTPLANVLGPTATALIPTAKRLPATLRDARVVFQGAALLPLKQIGPFVNAVLPLARELPATSRELSEETPPLIASFKVLEYVTNELAYSNSSNPGFLYWLAWTAHNADSLVSTEDANGSVLRGTAVVSCTTLETTPIGPLLTALLGNLGCGP
jgi:phospholipid/cholesterol/gamma-HCH transport system substrate-binding protein